MSTMKTRDVRRELQMMSPMTSEELHYLRDKCPIWMEDELLLIHEALHKCESIEYLYNVDASELGETLQSWVRR